MSRHSLSTRFVLKDIEERNILDDNAFDIFEPTLGLLIEGKDVLKENGISDIRNAVVMHFMEEALRVTRYIVNELAQSPEREYAYWFLGTGFGIKARRHGMTLELKLEIDPHMGPVSSSELSRKTIDLARVSIKDWVEAIICLSKELSGLFYRVHPNLQALRDQERQRLILEKWLKSANQGQV